MISLFGSNSKEDSILLKKEEILKLKREKNFVIIAHNYVDYDLAQIADITGDSLALAKKAIEIESENILFLGVDFMAETVKILNPKKRVLVPEKSATCPMANALSREVIINFKIRYPEAAVVLYVNSTAESKTEADYTCTSANAVEVVSNIENDVILFGPDKNLASHVAAKTGKKVIPMPGDDGFCCVHENIQKERVYEKMEFYPNAKFITHPECNLEVRKNSHFIGSTGQMFEIPQTDDSLEYIIGTEVEMVKHLQNRFKDKKFYALDENAVCTNMKKNSLDNVLECLKNETFEIVVPEDIALKAVVPIKNMFDIMKVK